MAQSTSSLSLNEIWSVEWSGTTRISTVVANDEGVVGIQSGPWVHLLIDSQAPTLVGNFEGLDIGGVAITGPGLELVDRRASRLVGTETDGRIRSRLGIPVMKHEKVVSGASTPCGWFIGLVGEPAETIEQERVLAFNPERALNRRIEVPFPPTQMTATGESVVISESVPPYRVSVLACGKEAIKSIDTSEVQVDLDLDAWRPLPAFALGERILQTWVDARSDRRRFAIYSINGRVLRWTDIDAPMTLVAANSAGLVIGLRTITGLEIVGFDASDQPES